MDQRQRPSQLAAIDAMIDRGDHGQARARLGRLAAGPSPHPDAVAAMAYVLERLGELERAEHYARRTLELLPRDPRAAHNLGNLLLAMDRAAEAEPMLRGALELDPSAPQTWLALGNAVRATTGGHAAAAVFREGMSLCGELPALRNNLALALHSIGRVDEALPILRDVVAIQPDRLVFADALCAMLNYAPGVGQREQFEAHARYGRLLRALAGPTVACPATPNSQGSRLRLGLLSPDLRDHAIAYLIRGLLGHADRGRVEIACYNVATREDPTSASLRSLVARWRHVPRLSPRALADLIRKDHVEVLIDLAGHTNSHRLLALAHRPAPLQATYMGYPNTTGIDCVDLRISDVAADPPDTGALNTERLAHLDRCFLNYTPPDDAPPVAWPPVAAGVTFACLGSLLKYNRELLTAWARVLDGAPGSRLLLKHHGLAEPRARQDVLDRLEELGVDPSRILAEPPGASARDMLTEYARADISLDTFPYTGTTTICESLLMGVPVVSMRTDTPAGRVSTSLLGAVGLGEFVASDPAGYVRLATDLARDAPRRASLRGNLRPRLLASAVCDGARFASEFVTLVEREWSRRARPGP